MGFKFMDLLIRPPLGRVAVIHFCLEFGDEFGFDDVNDAFALATGGASSQSDARPLSFSLSESLLCILW